MPSMMASDTENAFKDTLNSVSRDTSQIHIKRQDYPVNHVLFYVHFVAFHQYPESACLSSSLVNITLFVLYGIFFSISEINDYMTLL